MRALVYFALIMFIVFGHTHSQTSISLNFSATHNGVNKPLDSIYITNLTRGGDTMLYGNDTVLILDHGIGTPIAGNIKSAKLTIQPAMPNPFKGLTTLQFFIPGQDDVYISIYDLTGREEARFSGHLRPGNHSFSLQRGLEGICFVSIVASEERKVYKLISLGDNSGSTKLGYNGWQPCETMQKRGKNGFQWQPGDTLRYFGFATMNSIAGHNIIEDNPVLSEQYIFELINGLPCLNVPFVTDINGNTYRTVKIGTQCWLRENLNVLNYNDGVAIPHVSGNSAWANQNSGARCWYGNDSATYATVYGGMYNWHAVNSGKLCPTGWHVPTNSEWTTLTDFVGGTSTAGNTLKSTLTEPSPHPRWNSPNSGATNATGFSALPGGYRNYSDGMFDNIGYGGHWWTSTAHSSTRAYRVELYSIVGSVFTGNDDYVNAFSVRCVKD